MHASSLLTLAALAGAVAAQVECTNYVVTSKSSYDTTCDGSQGTHAWPVGVDASYCHGWSASDASGNTQKYSATNLRCSSDSTMFLYTQHDGTTDCSSIANNVKELNFTLSCTKDVANLYQTGLDFSCCNQRSAAFGNCNRAQPVVTWPTSQPLSKFQTFANGQLCAGSDGNSTTAPKTKPAVTTTKPAPTTAVATPAPSSASLASIAVSVTAVAAVAALL
ncbi:hypothetical protein SPRG_20511 [Saprolegnia parasitica CBS 223.65]|uniref:Secreted protein n=1 Tax=Saprolegnia parasitica (strain CBS 223.65) TaxID=695850 RepID=A0A067CIW2_SAPPC|nr:hypothetical protein SPRG_20511 [Saprolegnia parasitica CBS 223.65]KDO26712.1 hypothetical protein SPRG_20511 [Saprolegnia parasitica CBS 223.65]|eukprot:XP_012202597.1 hypothetical protein SPRG_20511 [Saprolegnia parasitica CBS 223.65]